MISEEGEPTPKEWEPVAINRTHRHIILVDGTLCNMDTLLTIDGEEVDDVSEACGTVYQLPDGRWTCLLFAWFDATPTH